MQCADKHCSDRGHVNDPWLRVWRGDDSVPRDTIPGDHEQRWVDARYRALISLLRLFHSLSKYLYLTLSLSLNIYI